MIYSVFSRFTRNRIYLHISSKSSSIFYIPYGVVLIRAMSSTKANAGVGLLAIFKQSYLCAFSSSYSSMASMMVLNNYTDRGLP